MTPFVEAFPKPLTEDQEKAVIEDAKRMGIGDDEIRTAMREAANNILYVNDTYQVAVKHHGSLIHLSIKRLDREPIHDWRDLQTIKNEMVGPECEGIELYPAESRLVDTANQYHLWVVADPDFRFPFGFSGRRLTDDGSKTGSIHKQRPFKNR